MAHPLDVDDIILNFDPAKPHAGFERWGFLHDILVAEAALPVPGALAVRRRLRRRRRSPKLRPRAPTFRSSRATTRSS